MRPRQGDGRALERLYLGDAVDAADAWPSASGLPRLAGSCEQLLKPTPAPVGEFCLSEFGKDVPA